MGKQKRAIEKLAIKQKLTKIESSVVNEPVEELANLAGLQTVLLSDGLLSSIQRRALATQIEEVKGNRYLERVVTSLRHKKKTTMIEAKDKPTTFIQRYEQTRAGMTSSEAPMSVNAPTEQAQTNRTDPNRVDSRRWSIKYLGSGGAVVTVAFFELKNVDTGHVRKLMFIGGGLSKGVTASGPGPSGFTEANFETPRPVNFYDFNWALGRLTTAGFGLGFGYALTFLSISNAQGDLVTSLELHGVSAMAIPGAGVYLGTFKLM